MAAIINKALDKIISTLYGKFFIEIKKQCLITDIIEDLVLGSIRKIYGVTNKKIKKANSINGKVKNAIDKLHLSQNNKLIPKTKEIIIMNIHTIVDFFRLFLNSVKKFCIIYPSLFLTNFKFTEYKAIVEDPIVIMGMLQTIHKMFKRNKSLILDRNFEKPPSILKKFVIQFLSSIIL